MPGAIGHPAEIVGILAHDRENHAQYLDVASFVIGANQIRIYDKPKMNKGWMLTKIQPKTAASSFVIFSLP